MRWLFYLCLILAPVITYPNSCDPFTLKTLLISCMGFMCLGYWLLRNPRIKPIPLYFAWCLVSYGYCRYKLGHPAEEMLLLISYLGIYLIAKEYLNKETTIKVLLISLVITLAYNFIGNHYQFHYHGISTSFVNKNLYSGWLCLLLPIVLARAIKGDISDWLIFVSGILVLFGIGCRSSTFAVGAGIAVFLAFLYDLRGKIAVLCFIGLFLLFAWYKYPHELVDPVRSYFWQGEIEQIKAHPIIGTGYGSFSTYYPEYKLNVNDTSLEGRQPNHILDYAHNEPFNILAEIGIIGLGLFLWTIYRAFKKTDKTNIYNMAMIAGIFGCLIDNFWNVSLRYSAIGLVFWLFMGLLNKKEDKIETDSDYRVNGSDASIHRNISMPMFNLPWFKTFRKGGNGTGRG